MQILNKDRIGALIVFTFCIGAWSMLSEMPAEAAFFPRIIIGLAFLLTVIWGASTFSARAGKVVSGSSEESVRFMKNPRNWGIFFICLVVYIVLIDTIGYFTSTVLFISMASFALGFRKFGAITVTVVGFVSFIYFIFVFIFQRPLPVEFFQPQ